MATATSKLQIIVDVLGDKAQKGLGGIQSSLANIAMVTGTVVAAGYAAKQAWDFTKEGAELEKVAGQFENVATNAGYAADVLLNEMRAATGGLVSDAELVASGLNIIELGLADSQQGVVDLATVVSTLGLDMQQVIMTFANDSIMRLDALGLSVETVTNRAAELKAEGFVGDAFDQAVLEGLQKRMEVLGDVTETTAGQMQMLETTFANAKAEAGLLAAELAGPSLKGFNDNAAASRALKEAADNYIISGLDYAVMQNRLNEGTDTATQVLERLTELTENHSGIMGYAAAEAANWDNEQRNLTESWSSGNAVAELYASNAAEIAAAAYEAGDAIRSENTALGAQAGLLDGVNTSLSNYIDTLREQAEFVESGGKALQDQAEALRGLYDSGEIGFDDLQSGLDVLDMANIDRLMEVGDLDTDAAVAELVELGVPVDDAILKVADMQTDLYELTAQEYTVRLNVITSGAIPSTVPIQGLGGGGSSGGSSGGGSGGGSTIGGEEEGFFAGFSGAGGDTFIIEGDIILSASSPAQFAAGISNKARSAAMAGSQ